TAQMREVATAGHFPNCLTCRFGNEECDSLALKECQPFDYHQANEGLSETNTIAQESATIPIRDFHQGSVAFALILIEDWIDTRAAVLRASTFPLTNTHFVTTKVFGQRLGVNVERQVFASVAFDGLEDF